MPDENTKTVIIHGWSDCSESFKELKQFLIQNGFPSQTIYYADYESREDNITFNDVVDGLNDEFIKNEFIKANGDKLVDLNIIVHSTGGLVIRNWISRYYKERSKIDKCPIKRLVMLAPANFGSPLAHRGKSFLGGIFRGRWKIGDFLELGRKLLDGLELASPYQWRLSMNDLLDNRNYFNVEQIHTTILVGIQDYQGIMGWINKPGTDGTVVIAGTTINCAKLLIDFSGCGERDLDSGRCLNFKWSGSQPVNDFAFGVLQGVDHGGIVEQASKDGNTSKFLLKALQTNKASFETLKQELAALTEETYQVTKKSKFQQFLIHAVDDFDEAINDFTLEFFLLKKADKQIENFAVMGKSVQNIEDEEQEWSMLFNRLITMDFHKHTVDPSFRRFLVDLDKMSSELSRAKQSLNGEIILTMKISVPRIDKGIYYETDNLQNIIIYDSSKPESTGGSGSSGGLTFFYPNTTTLIEMKVNRANKYVTVGLEARKQ